MYELGSPLLLVIEVTDKCNLKCVYCYNEFGNKKLKDINRDSLVSVLHEARDIGVFDINFCGGEPFSNKDFMVYVELAIEFGFDVTINTNGTLISESIAKRLKELDLIQHIQVSFDGHNKEINDLTRGKFERAHRGFQFLCREAGCRSLSPSVGVVLSKSNFIHLENIVAYFSNYTDRIHLMNVMGHPELMLDEADQELLVNKIIPAVKILCKESGTQVTKINKNNTCDDFLFKHVHVDCLAGHTFLAISSDLELYPCDIHRECIHKWESMGDIIKAHKKTLEKWRNMKKPWCYSDDKCTGCLGS